MAHPATYASSLNSVISDRDLEIELDHEQIAERHVHDSSSVAPSRAEQAGLLLRSPTMWGLLYLPALTVIAALAYMAIHLCPGPGRIFGAGDRGSPNAHPSDK